MWRSLFFGIYFFFWDDWIMLLATQARAVPGHAFLDKARRPGLTHALVISEYSKFRAEIVSALSFNFSVDYYTTTQASMTALRQGKTPSVIVMDYRQMVTQSKEFLKEKSQSDRLRDVPIIVTGRVDEQTFNETVRQTCRVLYLRRPFMKSHLRDVAARLVDGPIEDNWKVLPKRQKEALMNSVASFRDTTKRVNKGMALNMIETKENCVPLMEEVLEGNAGELIANLKGHHNYAYVHSVKVATLLSLLGNAIGIKGKELLTITAGGLLIDVGKLATPQDVLNSPENLDHDQLKELKKHVFHSHSILKGTENVGEGVKIIAEQHHEKIDGSGYPRGLKGKELNELARLSAIADIFCALTDERPYKPSFTFEASIAILEKMEGQIDPFLLKLFKEIVKSAFAKKVLH
jgi:HD-GYP domain-containing protein (c-di-GMP phosphodiesterase class II)